MNATNSVEALPMSRPSPDGWTDPGIRGSRVLFVINSLGGGGAERSLAELLPYFQEAGFAPLIACLARREEGVQEEVEEGNFDLRFLAGSNVVGWARGLRDLIRSEAVGLVHTTLFESDVAGRLAAVRTGVPVLTSLVNTSYSRVRLTDPNVSRLGLEATRVVDGWTARHLTTHFHAITHAVKEAGVEALGIPAERITVIERGRDPEWLGSLSEGRRRRARTQLGLGEDDEVVVHVGRQDFQKGQRFLIEAIARLASTRPHLRLVVAGRSGHASKSLAKMLEETGVQARVRFLGHRRDIPEILSAADLFVFPSLYEGQGGALVEAMGMGLPIVGSDIPSTREVVERGRNALLVPPRSPEDLARAISELLENPGEARAFGQRSREIFLERFTVERSAARMTALYRRLLDVPASDPNTPIAS